MRHFPLDQNYAVLLKAHGISIEELLKRAKLPLDLFQRQNPCVTSEEYYRFMRAIEDIVSDQRMPIMLATSESIETITPPIFAAYCSANARECIYRIAQYKALVGAVLFEITEDEKKITVKIQGENAIELPEIIVGIEMVLLTNLIRKATKESVTPARATVQKPFVNPNYEKFLACTIQNADENSIIFCRQDAEIPFVTGNESMWNFLEPELKKRLRETDADDSFSAKVRSVLTELLPAGNVSVEDAAKALGMSRRSLQRKLKEEGTTFQKQLNHVRELLAKNYIQNTQLTSTDIAYLLGYQDLNSFFRAFSLWTGDSVTAYKQKTARKRLEN